MRPAAYRRDPGRAGELLIASTPRYAQNRLRAIPPDRKTEAELVEKDQTKRKPVETFTPEEFEAFLGVVRPEWLPWLALGGLAGIRTDGEILRITWECAQERCAPASAFPNLALPPEETRAINAAYHQR